MKVSKGWTVPGNRDFTSRRGDVEVDETDLLRLLKENTNSLDISKLSEKEVYTLLDTEADKYITLQQMVIGAISADEGKSTLSDIKRIQKSVLDRY